MFIFRRSANGTIWTSWKLALLHWLRRMGQSSCVTSKSLDHYRASQYWKVQERQTYHHHRISQHCTLLSNARVNWRRCSVFGNLHFKLRNSLDDSNISRDSFKIINFRHWVSFENAIMRFAFSVEQALRSTLSLLNCCENFSLSVERSEDVCRSIGLQRKTHKRNARV